MLNKIEKSKYLLAIGDLLIINLAYVTSLLLRFSKSLNKISIGRNGLEDILVFSVIGIFWIWIFQVHGLYKRQGFLSIARQLVDLLRASLIGTALVTIIAFFSKSELVDNSRLVLGYFAIFNFLYLIIWRIIIYKNLYKKLAEAEILKTRVLIVGAGSSGKFLAASISDRELDSEVVGFLDDFKADNEIIFKNLKVLGTIDEIRKIIEEYSVDRVIIALSNVTHDRLMDIINTCCVPGINVRIYSDLYNVISSKTEIEEFSKIPLIDITGIKLEGTTYVIKRFLDIAGSLAGLILLSPLMLVVSILIKLTSRGPVIFKQERIGKDGKPFWFYKFRSMKAGSDNPEEAKHHEQYVSKLIEDSKKETQKEKVLDTEIKEKKLKPRKLVNDPRVTWIGKIIRKTSIDELPQLYNVLKGDMSLVGPRPCLRYEYDQYLDWHKARLRVLPGCTGLWQVTGRSEVSFNDMVIMDFYYINNISPWFDLQLILKTFPVMFFGKGGF
ncbi:MAG: sugar transferase [Candidatus Coatesbacteria bacterium]|nr:sugar transferase [Candidatus Coatesbacteria bacterium]